MCLGSQPTGDAGHKPGGMLANARRIVIFPASEYHHALCPLTATEPVSYTHLTLPTIYSV